VSRTRLSARRKLAWLALGVGAALLASGVALPAAGRDAPGAPAQVVDYKPPIRMESYRVTDYGRSASARDDTVSKAKFRVVERTGNCCENYVTISPEGRLLDLGGSYINFTDDGGKTWRSVRPIEPLVNGEGTIAVAPGGDITGVEWDPYSGDHLLSYKYDAAAEEWQYLEMPLHTPFYDRPWLTLVPGPFDIGGEKIPYVTFVDGYPHRGTFLYSTDGLTYVETSNPFIDREFESATKGWLKTKPNPNMDWFLPNSESPITPLGGGSAIAAPGPFTSSWSVLDPKTQTWSAMELPDGQELDGRLLVDSKGRIHNLLGQGTSIEYRISGDGGRSWKSVVIELPEGKTVSQIDFRVSTRAGIAAVATHAGTATGDQDLLYKIDVSGSKPRLLQMYEIGLGDTNSAAGVGQDIRMDFQTVAIFPDGRVALSFLDSTTGPVFHLQEPINPDRLGPALAIEI
jgi:hypothetical protein